MANRRMFSMKIVDTDAFLDMPQSSQLLYFQLAMRADDDGFVSNPKKIMRMLGSNEDDYKVLVVKKFIIPFESGVCVIKHWLIHNLIRGDRYIETQWTKEKEMLVIDEKTSKYSLNKGENNVIPNGNQMATQVRLGKVSIGKDRGEEKIPSQINKDFFEQGETYKAIYEEYVVKIDSQVVDREFKKFSLYWTELNATGKKERWEQQPTFDVRRRLYKWFSGIAEHKQFTSNKGKGIA